VEGRLRIRSVADFVGRRRVEYPRAVPSWFVYVAECADGSLYTC
jgi:hypothetical protein